MSFKALLVSALLGSCAAFSLSPARPAQRRAAPSVVRMASATDTKAILKRTLERTDEVGLLTKLANTGLLRKASNAGVKFADLEPLLKLADDQGLLYVLDAVSEDALPLLPTLVETAPAVLPLAAGALSIPAPLYFLLALGCPLGAYEITQIIPDDTVVNIALQTLLAVPLATAFPVLFGGVGVVAGKIQS